MQKAIFRSSLLCAALALSATASQAAWTTFGDVSEVNGSVTMTTSASATYQDDFPLAAGALNLSGKDPLAAGFDLENAIGLVAGALDKSVVEAAMEGSAVRSSFAVSAGQTLSFDWLLASRDVGAGFGLDYAFISINGALMALADAASASEPGTGDYLAQTGLQHFSYTFADAGVFDIAIGVVDVGDFIATSALTFNNFAVANAVPEPGSLPLLLAGLAGVAAVVRRRAPKA